MQQKQAADVRIMTDLSPAAPILGSDQGSSWQSRIAATSAFHKGCRQDWVLLNRDIKVIELVTPYGHNIAMPSAVEMSACQAIRLPYSHRSDYHVRSGWYQSMSSMQSLKAILLSVQISARQAYDYSLAEADLVHFVVL